MSFFVQYYPLLETFFGYNYIQWWTNKAGTTSLISIKLVVYSDFRPKAFNLQSYSLKNLLLTKFSALPHFLVQLINNLMECNIIRLLVSWIFVGFWGNKQNTLSKPNNPLKRMYSSTICTIFEVQRCTNHSWFFQFLKTVQRFSLNLEC